MLSKFIQNKLEKIQNSGRFRQYNINSNSENNILISEDKKLINFASNDYLGLSFDKEIQQTASDASLKYGNGSVSSRLITGNCPLYEELEENISKIYNTESALVFSSGYMACLGVVSAIIGKDDLVVMDKLMHNCAYQAVAISGAKLIRFAHNDYNSLEQILFKHRKEYKNCLIITESLFGMDGDYADIKKIVEMAKKYNSWSMVDYAHDVNFANDKTAEKPDIIMGTLSKAFASQGGYIAGSKLLRDFLYSSSANLIYNTALPAYSLACANEVAKRILYKKVTADRAFSNAQLFCKRLKNISFDNNKTSQIIAYIDELGKLEKIKEKAKLSGYYVHIIKPPTVAENKARIRVSFNNNHTQEEVAELTDFFTL